MILLIIVIILVVLMMMIIILNSNRVNPFPNLIQIKTNKTGGTTLSSIVRRIGSYHNLSGINSNNLSVFTKESMLWAFHNNYVKMESNIAKLKGPNFILTSIRDPSRRAYSEYYHNGVSRMKQKDTFDNKVKYMNREKNSLCKYLKSKKSQNVDDIINLYDFILIMDRYNESLVVLSDILNIPIDQVWYIKSKDSLTFKMDDIGAKFTPNDYDNESDQFYLYVRDTYTKNNADDYELYRKVNEKLDKQIGKMGNRFYDKLEELEYSLVMINERCKDCIHKAQNGVDVNSYLKDIGICYECLDKNN